MKNSLSLLTSILYLMLASFCANANPILVGVPDNVEVSCLVDVPAIANVTATDDCDPDVAVSFVETMETNVPCGNIITRIWQAVSTCGDTTTASQLIAVIDLIDPVLVGLPGVDITVDCNNIPDAPIVSATDNCNTGLDVEFEEVFSSPCVLERTWSVSDECGNISIGTQTITIIGDTESPVLVGVPSDTIGECGSAPFYPWITATDDCDTDVYVTLTEFANSNGCMSTIESCFTAVDNCGNTVTECFITTFQDLEPPMFYDFPDDIVAECDNVPPVPPVPSVGATDNCDDDVAVTFEEYTEQGPCYDCYTITRCWTASDGNCSNDTTQCQIIEVTDTTIPVIVDTLSDFTGTECDYEFEEAEFYDNCDLELTIVYTINIEELDCSGCYEITKCWLAIDNLGLCTDNFCQVLSVMEASPPSFIGFPEDIEVPCDLPFNLDTAVVVATDNCDLEVDVEFEEQILGDCNLVLRIWTATDDLGLVTIDTQFITFGPMLQTVFSPGATWTYGYDSWYQSNTWTGYETWSYVGIQIFDDIEAHVVKRVSYHQNSSNELVEQDEEDYYFRVEGNKIYGDVDLTKTLTLNLDALYYDFDALVGDIIEVSDYLRLEVVEREIINFNGIDVLECKAIQVCEIDGVWAPMVGAEMLVYNSRIGGMNYFNMFRHSCILDGSPRYYNLRCYQDDELGEVIINDVVSCDFVDGIVATKDINNADISIFPSPVNDYLVLELDQDLQISIYDLNGLKLYDSELKKGKSNIDFSTFTQGVYFIELINGHNRFMKKIVKQ